MLETLIIDILTIIFGLPVFGFAVYFGLSIGFCGTSVEPYIDIIWWCCMALSLLLLIGVGIYTWKKD